MNEGPERFQQLQTRSSFRFAHNLSTLEHFLNPRRKKSDDQSNRTAEEDFDCALDSDGEAGGTSPAEDAGRHDYDYCNRSDTPAPRNANETRAEKNGSRYTEQNPNGCGAEEIKKDKADSTADQRVDDAGVESLEGRGEIGLCDNNHRNEGPERIMVCHTVENKPNNDAADENAEGILKPGCDWSGRICRFFRIGHKKACRANCSCDCAKIATEMVAVE